MKYAIHRYDYAYDDCFFINYGRTIYQLKSFDDESQARHYWATLERQSLQDDGDCIDSREPLASYDNKLATVIHERFKRLLAEFGYPLSLEIENNGRWSYDNLNLDKLTDEQLLKLLCDCQINYFVVSAYQDDDYVYLMNLGNRQLTYWNQGYLRTTGNTPTEHYVEVAHPDDFFSGKRFEFELGISKHEPLATYFTQADKDSVLVQSLLKQYSDVFIIFEDIIYFIGSAKDYPEFSDLKLDALKAMNAVLTTPFYQIESYTPEQMLEKEQLFQEKQQRREFDNDAALPSFDRYLHHINSLNPDYVETVCLRRTVEFDNNVTAIYTQQLPVSMTDEEIRERIRLPDTAWDDPTTAPYMRNMLIDYLKSNRTVLATTEIVSRIEPQTPIDLTIKPPQSILQKLVTWFK